MGQFAKVYEILMPFVTDATVFLQSLAVSVMGIMFIYFKLREMMADQQMENMWSHKAKSLFTILISIFLLPTIIDIVQFYFFKK